MDAERVMDANPILDPEFDLKDISPATITGVPWYFRVACQLSKHKVRGAERLLSQLRRRGLLDRLAVYALGNVQLRVPLWRPSNQWLESDVRAYEARFMSALSGAIAELSGPVTLIDCGADIGTVSAHLVSRCGNITRVIAFEPNAAAFRVLEQNLLALPIQAEARPMGVADFRGRGRLLHPANDPSAHAMYVSADAEGPITVERIDDLELADGGACVIKIDVEGGEAAVVAGAAETIRRAAQVLVGFEAHPRVAKRRGRDPVETMHALLAIRPFTFSAVSTPECQLTPDLPLFDQLPPIGCHNIIAHSDARGP